MVALETASILCLAHAFTEKCLVVNVGHIQMSVLICSGTPPVRVTLFKPVSLKYIFYFQLISKFASSNPPVGLFNCNKGNCPLATNGS